MNKKTFERFCNQFPQSITLAFGLKPMGKTIEYIKEKGLISQDERRAEEYQVVKQL